MPKEGDEPMDEDTRSLHHRKLRFKLLTKGFYFVEEKKVVID